MIQRLGVAWIDGQRCLTHCDRWLQFVRLQIHRGKQVVSSGSLGVQLRRTLRSPQRLIKTLRSFCITLL